MDETTKKPLWQQNRGELVDSFLATSWGQRLAGIAPDDLWQALEAGVALAVTIEHAGLASKAEVNVHIHNPSAPMMADRGLWLHLARAFLPNVRRIRINLHLATDCEPLTNPFAAPVRPFVETLGTARIRHHAEDELYRPHPSADLLIMGMPQPEPDEPDPLDLVPCVGLAPTYMTHSDLLVAALLAAHLRHSGAEIEPIWLESALENWINYHPPGEHERTPSSALLIQVKQAPAQAVDRREFRNHIHCMMMRDRKTVLPPSWPGRDCAGDGPHAGCILLDEAFVVDVGNGQIKSVDGVDLGDQTIPMERLATLPPAHPEDPQVPVIERIEWVMQQGDILQRLREGIGNAATRLANDDKAVLDLFGFKELPETFGGRGTHLETTNRIHNAERTIQRLLSRGAIDEQDRIKQTMLMAAMIHRQMDLFEGLLQSGADTTAIDITGRTALSIAMEMREPRYMLMLRAYGADFDALTPSGLPIILLQAFIEDMDARNEARGLTETESLGISRYAEAVAYYREHEDFEGPLAGMVKPLIERLEKFDREVDDRLEAKGLPRRQASVASDTPAPTESSATVEDVRETEDLGTAIRLGLGFSLEESTPAPLPLRVDLSPPMPSTPVTAKAPSPVSTPSPDDAEAEAPTRDEPATAVVQPDIVQPQSEPILLLTTVTGRLGFRHPELAPAETLDRARAAVLAWLRKDKKLAVADHGGPQQLDDAHSSLLVDADDHLWAMRYDDRDRHVAGRIWRTEIVLHRANEQVNASIRLLCLRPTTELDTPVEASIPRVVTQLAETLGISDAGAPLRRRPWVIERPEDVGDVVSLIRNPDRRQPVMVTTGRHTGWLGSDQNPGLLHRLQGHAHLVQLHGPAMAAWTRSMGRPEAIHGEALRLYRPGWTVGEAKARNPLFIINPQASRSTFINRVVAAGAELGAREASEDTVPGFALARTVIATQLRKRAALASEQVRQAERDTSTDERIKILEEQLAAARLLHQAAETERDNLSQQVAERDALDQQDRRRREAEATDTNERLREELEQAIAANDILRRNLDAIHRHEQIEQGTITEDQPTQVPIPDNLQALEEWATLYLPKEVTIHKKAINAASKINHQQPERVYQALMLLADEYLASIYDPCEEARVRLEERQKALHLEISPTGSAVDNRQYRDQYRVSWEGRQYKLDMHVSGNSSRNTEKQVRVYFAVDEERGQIIIGHLPTHLDNSWTAR